MDDIKKIKFDRVLLFLFSFVLVFSLITETYFINIIFPLLKVVYLIFLNIIIGFFISKKEKSNFNILENLAKGLAFTTAYFYLVSIFKILNEYTIIFYLVLPLFALFFISKIHLYNGLKRFFDRDGIEYLFFIIPLVYAVLPSTFFDTLVYHLGLPNLYLQNGGFVSTPQFMFANMSIYYEIFLIPSVFLGDLVPRILHFLVGSIFILSVSDYVAVRYKIEKNIFLAVIAFLPVSVFLLATIKADLITALFIYLGIKKYAEEKFKCSAFFWGFAIGVKYFSGLALIVFFTIVIIKNKKIDLKRHSIMSFIFLLTVLPLLVKNYFFAHNPLYPFFFQLFSNEFWDMTRYTIVKNEVGRAITTFSDLLKSPYALSYKIHGSGGMAGPVFLIFLPFLILFKKIKSKKLEDKYLLFFSLSFLFIGLFFTEAIRYFYIVFIYLSVFVALAYKIIDSKIMKIILVFLIIANGIYSFYTLETIYSGRKIYFQNKTIDEYRLNYFPVYKAYKTLEHISKSNDKVLVAGDTRGYLLKRKYSIASPYDYSILKKYLKRSNTKEEFFKLLKADDYKYLIFNLREFKRLQSYTRLDDELTIKLYKFLQNTIPIRSENPIFIYKTTN